MNNSSCSGADYVSLTGYKIKGKVDWLDFKQQKEAKCYTQFSTKMKLIPSVFFFIFASNCDIN